jgi:hypothetical protein
MSEKCHAIRSSLYTSPMMSENPGCPRQPPWGKSSNCASNFLTLRSASGAAGVPPHGNGLLVFLDVLEEFNGPLQLPALDGLGGLACVFERNSKICASGAG